MSCSARRGRTSAGLSTTRERRRSNARHRGSRADSPHCGRRVRSTAGVLPCCFIYLSTVCLAPSGALFPIAHRAGRIGTRSCSNLNDKISSIRIPTGETWEVCQDIDYGNQCQVLSSSVADLRSIGWNDRISSLPRTNNNNGRFRDRRSGSGNVEGVEDFRRDKGAYSCAVEVPGKSVTAQAAAQRSIRMFRTCPGSV
jgi:hypothetical protein